MKSNKFWVLILLAVLLASSVAALAVCSAPAAWAHISLDGINVESVDLSSVFQPRAQMLESSYGFNVVDIENGRIRVSEADCPDRLCIRQGWAGGGAIPIVCMPNRLVISFNGGNEQGIDAVTR